jgi:hypothetical protein
MDELKKLGINFISKNTLLSSFILFYFSLFLNFDNYLRQLIAFRTWFPISIYNIIIHLGKLVFPWGLTISFVVFVIFFIAHSITDEKHIIELRDGVYITFEPALQFIGNFIIAGICTYSFIIYYSIQILATGKFIIYSKSPTFDFDVVFFHILALIILSLFLLHPYFIEDFTKYNKASKTTDPIIPLEKK